MADVQGPETNPYAPPRGKVFDGGLATDCRGEDVAGFWRRSAAAATDAVLVTFALYVVLVVLALVLDTFFPRDPSLWPAVIALAALAFYVLFVVGYFVVMECSPWQATPGKMAFGIKVTDLHGRPASFGRALARLLGKVVSSFFLIGFLMAAVTRRKQALHDKVAGTLVMKVR